MQYAFFRRHNIGVTLFAMLLEHVQLLLLLSVFLVASVFPSISRRTWVMCLRISGRSFIACFLCSVLEQSVNVAKRQQMEIRWICRMTRLYWHFALLYIISAVNSVFLLREKVVWRWQIQDWCNISSLVGVSETITSSSFRHKKCWACIHWPPISVAKAFFVFFARPMQCRVMFTEKQI